ncbi:MAG: hypothetical protein IGS49_28240 [Chlorogloeopsis fritschii C42_A2020_084]|uniref:hypothetical protein n=1 Tax=Chlorogloeopsis fritschii TaxID=1124 RepID=UPI0019EB6B2D|nr:hypothetical protein [Chlorogloeopsis fritschii]MBF2009227.1 hypothetical protein [Chlorogloeopsis fritschii C42_A2020_084]
MLLWWILANAVGGAVVGALEESGFQFLATLILTGPILGVAQWFVLRRYLRYAYWWILASTFGWLLGIQVRIAAGRILDPIVEILLAVGGFGEVFWLNVVKEPVTAVGLGIAQWLILRHYSNQAGWWIVANVLGGCVNGAVSSAVCAAICQTLAMKLNAGVASAIAYGTGWAGSALVTGIMLVWLFSNRHK